MGEYENVQGNKGEVLEQAPDYVAQKEKQAVDVLFNMFPHKAAKTGLDKAQFLQVLRNRKNQIVQALEQGKAVQFIPGIVVLPTVGDDGYFQVQVDNPALPPDDSILKLKPGMRF
jgi:hypothetical protein